MKKHLQTAAALSATMTAGLCAAQSAQPVDSTLVATTRLPDVVVSATRQASPTLTVPATVTVIEQSEMQENLVTDFREMFRYEPGIAVRREPRGRGGEATIEIRGIGGQRVMMLVDGVRLPNGYAAAGSTMGQLMLDPLSLNRVEVLRGPASSLYGSDALAGVVLFHTLKPQDLLGEGATLGARASLGYDGSYDGTYANANLAFVSGPVQTLLGVTATDGHELKNHGDSVLKPNPQDNSLRNFLFKTVANLDAAQSLTLTGERYELTTETDQLSLRGPISGGTLIQSSRADDESTRWRVGLAYRNSVRAGWFDNLQAQIDYQRSESTERTFESRKPPGPAPVLLRDTLLSSEESQWSGSVQLDGLATVGSSGHRWVAGVDALFRSISPYSDGYQRTITGTGGTNVIDGEIYPRRTAPESDVDNIGVFLQDEIAFGDGRLRVTPGLRYDYYSITSRPDAWFANANVAGRVPVDLSDNALTPRIGLTYEWLPQQVLYTSYVQGFRMPTYDQLNRVGQLTVATFVHDFIPAPDLQPESSNGFELGVRGRANAGSYELVTYYNRYTDFIETQLIAFIPAGPSNPRPTRRFQARNIGKVEIYGVEARGELLLNTWLDTADRWSLVGAAQWSRGDDETNNQPLNSIPPASLVAGVRWQAAGGRYGSELSATFVDGKTRVNRALTQTGPTAPVPLTTGGYGVVDLTGFVQLLPQVTLNLGVFNLFDREYYDWSMVSGLTGNDARLAAYTAPGRYVSARLTVTY